MDKAVEDGFDGMIVYVNQAGKSSFYSAGLTTEKIKFLPTLIHYSK
jgi:D-alanyl-D-alanine carboxypeptidase